MVACLGGTGWVLLAALAAAPADDGSKTPATQPPAGLMARFQAIRDEYDAANRAAREASEQGKTEFESWKLYGAKMPSIPRFASRMVELAATAPGDPAAREAMLWVLDQPGMSSAGTYDDDYLRAALLLLRHHADHPDVARLGLQLDNICSRGRDLFLEGLVARARNHETRGLAEFSLGQYLILKANLVEGLRKTPADSPRRRGKMRIETFDDSGKRVEKELDLPVEERVYYDHLCQYDPEAIRAEARRLLEDVTKNYADVPLMSRRMKAMETALAQPKPVWNGEPVTPETRAQMEKILARKSSLADHAQRKLDEMTNIVVGKPAPPIEGKGMDGQPLKLADYRGKVVVLVFWGTWCGPCMAQVPHERELAAKYRDRPFALLGVDCESDTAAALAVMKKEEITWPNWNDGDPGEGPIARAYHVRGYPSSFVIDPQGTIRHIGLFGSSLDKAVGTLLAEHEAQGGRTPPK